MKHSLYRARFKLREWIPYAGLFPVHVDIELAGRCQLACTMCPYGTGEFDDSLQGMMPRKMAILAIHQASEGGSSSIKLNYRGEPGLYPDLPFMIKFAKEKGFVEVAINTNLTAFSCRRLKEVANAGLDLLIVSVDGATRETYEKIRINGDFEKLRSNLSFIRALGKRPRIRVQMVVQEENRHEVSQMRKVFGPLCDELVFQNIRSSNKGERKRCPQPWQRLIVAWDGTVFACCSNWQNEWPLGNIKETSLKDIWKGRRLRELRMRAAHPESGFPCVTCKVGASYK